MQYYATQANRHLFLHLLADDLLERDNVGRELADTVRELLRRHLVLVQHPTEGLLVELDLLHVEATRLAGIEFLLNLFRARRQLVQELRRDGQTIASSQLGDLALVAEAGAHDNRVVSVLFVVVVNLGNRQDTWVFLGLETRNTQGSLVPVEDAAHKGANQGATGLGTRNRLGQRKDQGQVASNALLLQDFGGLDSFPSRRNLDENTALVDTHFLVELDDLASLGNGRLGIKRKASINLGRDVSRNEFGNLGTKVDRDLVLVLQESNRV